MFRDIGLKVVNVNQDRETDYAQHSVLTNQLSWKSVITNFLGPSMFNSQKVFLLLKYFKKYSDISTVVTDLDLSAVVAASMAKKKVILVTERYGSTISLIPPKNLKEAGFKFNNIEISEIQTAMRELFEWCLNLTDLIVTDCPYDSSLDNNTYFKSLLDKGKAKFVGPMIRDTTKFSPKTKQEVFSKLGLPVDAILITASIGGTAMFIENKKRMQNFYIQVFKKLHNWNPNIRMLLLARDNDLEVPKGIISLKYLPDWFSLLQASDLVLAHPGWITVTELSSLRVPSIFCLSSPKEYHEWDEFVRLKDFGFVTNFNLNERNLLIDAKTLLTSTENRHHLFNNAYQTVAPFNNGTETVSRMIHTIANERK